jgi:hypothetical protein
LKWVVYAHIHTHNPVSQQRVGAREHLVLDAHASHTHTHSHIPTHTLSSTHTHTHIPIAEQGVGLREHFVLDAHTSHPARLQLLHEQACVVEVAVAGVTVEQDGDAVRE